MRERLLHALDLAMLGDWDGAKRSLENITDPIVPRLAALFTEQEHRERRRAEVQTVARHELGNALAIAQVNLEALVDGVLAPTPERLAAIRDAMIACGVLLDDLKKQYRMPREGPLQFSEFDVCKLIAAQVALVAEIAESKSVHLRYEPPEAHTESCERFRGDRDRIALVLRDVLLGAVRYTPPGGSIAISRLQEDEIEFAISSGADPSKLLAALGPQIRIVAERARSATFALRLSAAIPQ